MVTVIDASLPTDQFALDETFDRMPTVEFDVVRAVANCPGAVMPFLWATAPDTVRLEELVQEDATTRHATRLSQRADRALFRVEWAVDVRLIVQALVEDHGTLLDIHGGEAGWTFRMLFRDREAVSTTYECCRKRGVELSIRRVHRVTGALGCAETGLTDEQYEALVTAFEHGYYAVPRGLTLEALADEMGVSHQALSERLRRGHQELIANTLCVAADPDPIQW